jgi:hypothetical protein
MSGSSSTSSSCGELRRLARRLSTTWSCNAVPPGSGSPVGGSLTGWRDLEEAGRPPPLEKLLQDALRTGEGWREEGPSRLRHLRRR